jgi:hypothetical protein
VPGPAPKPAAQRRRTNAAPGVVLLPAAGRLGPPPRWPLEVAEPPVWAWLWTLPQAVAWERLRLERVVARYAAALIAAESPDGSAAVMAEVRQIEDRLGLSAMAMLRLRWEIAEPPLEQPGASGVTDLADYRDL